MSHKNFSLALNLFLLAAGMLALAFASVPLYRLYCSATGYNGTTQRAAHAPAHAIDRDMTIDFNADTDPHLPWQFAPADRHLKIKVGQQVLTHFVAQNMSDAPVTGHAVYNVVPLTAGAYFVKIQCFCFTEQTLAAHQRVLMPVLFYVDPAIADDPQMNDVKTITLSYTFFPVKTE